MALENDGRAQATAATGLRGSYAQVFLDEGAPGPLFISVEGGPQVDRGDRPTHRVAGRSLFGARTRLKGLGIPLLAGSMLAMCAVACVIAVKCQPWVQKASEASTISLSVVDTKVEGSRPRLRIWATSRASGDNRTCHEPGTDCSEHKCCSNPGETCFEKDQYWASCKHACAPGVDTDDDPGYQTVWTCRVLTPDSPRHLPQQRPLSANSSNEVSFLLLPNHTLKDPAIAGALPPTTTSTAQATTQTQTATVQVTTTLQATTTQTTTLPATTTRVTKTTTTTTPSMQEVMGTNTPTLFCFVLMLPFGYELELMRTQARRQMGIFGCKSWRVYSNETMWLQSGPSAVKTEAMSGTLTRKMDPYTKTVQNTDIFIKLWAKVIADPKAWEHDWLVKVDPDAVFIAGRLRELLRDRWPSTGAREGLKAYLNNCHLGLHGPIEVLSRGALEAYNNGRGWCQKGWPADSPQEDAYLSRCLDMLGVERVDAFNVLSETHCGGYLGDCKSHKVAFHPFKTADGFSACWDSAMLQHWNQALF